MSEQRNGSTIHGKERFLYERNEYLEQLLLEQTAKVKELTEEIKKLRQAVGGP